MMIPAPVSRLIGKKRFLNRKLRMFHPKTIKFDISGSYSIFLDPRDLAGPSFYVMYGGAAAFYHYEEKLKADVVQYMKRDGVFIDVGANIGLISLFVSKLFPDSKIVSFEPGDVTHECLKETINHNGIKNIHLIKKGVSNIVQENVDFYIDPFSTGGSSLVIDKDKNLLSRPVEKISLTTLDKFIDDAGLVPTVIKVDVEDAEELVMMGAINVIKKFRPTFIIESNNEKILKNPNFFTDLFPNYSVREVGTSSFVFVEKLPELAQANQDKNRIYTDYLFVAN